MLECYNVSRYSCDGDKGMGVATRIVSGNLYQYKYMFHIT